MPKIIQINGKVNLIKNHVKIKTVSHCLVAAFFSFFLGIGGKIARIRWYTTAFFCLLHEIEAKKLLK